MNIGSLQPESTEYLVKYSYQSQSNTLSQILKVLFNVIQPLSGLGSCTFHYSIHFIFGYSHLNPSDLKDCVILGHIADNHKKTFTICHFNHFCFILFLVQLVE
jgi:hypothetical protein